MLCRIIMPVLCLLAGSGQAEELVTRYGARPDDATLATAGIQAAIDACAAAGGGVVRIPTGRFVSGTIRMKDKVRLHLDPGAILEGSRDLADYQPRG